MSERDELVQYVELALVGLFVLAAIAVYLLACRWPANAGKPEFASVNDRPLLDTPRQVQEARTSGRCSFRIGSEYFVVENLPREYVDWSANRADAS